MPRGNFAPLPAVGTTVDLALGGFASSYPLFTRGIGDSVTLTRAIWPDVVALACGRCSRVSLGQQVVNAGVGTVLFSDDRLSIASVAPFEVLPGAGNRAFGFDPAGQASAPLVGLQVLTARYDWTGGTLDEAFVIRQGGLDFAFPAFAGGQHNLITLLRDPSLSDEASDGAAECIEARDNAIYSPVLQGIHWYIDNRGHLCSDWPVGAGIEDIAWDTSTSAKRELLRALGRRGPDEAEHSTVVDNLGRSIRRWRASRPIAWLFLPGYPISSPERGRESEVKGGRLRSGRTFSNTLGEWSTFKCGLTFPGPGHGADDLTEHWARRFEPFFEGDVTFWQDWSDDRLARHEGDTDDLDGPYTLTRTAERKGRRGRMICSRPLRDSRRRAPRFRTTHRGLAAVDIDLDVLDPEPR